MPDITLLRRIGTRVVQRRARHQPSNNSPSLRNSMTNGICPNGVTAALLSHFHKNAPAKSVSSRLNLPLITSRETPNSCMNVRIPYDNSELCRSRKLPTYGSRMTRDWVLIASEIVMSSQNSAKKWVNVTNHSRFTSVREWHNLRCEVGAGHSRQRKSAVDGHSN